MAVVLGLGFLAFVAGAGGAIFVLWANRFTLDRSANAEGPQSNECQTALYKDGVWIAGQPLGGPFFKTLSVTLENHQPDIDVKAYPKPGETRLLKGETHGLLVSSLGSETVVTTVPLDESSVPQMASDVLRHLPAIIWSTTEAGEVRLQSNEAIRLLQDAEAEEPQSLFPQLPPRIPAGEPTRQRVAFHQGNTPYPTWYDFACFRQGADQIYFATNADNQVVTDRSRSSVVQALTKTFAHLSVGLAVFDNNGQLVLFNPALKQMVKLSIEFLSAKPTISAFLDQMREEGTLPEPKDYKIWRRAVLTRLATKGKAAWTDIWTLPDGRAFRVTGRTQTDTSIVFVIEDITSETTLTRRIREDAELADTAIELSNDAVGIFDLSGNLCLSNKRFDQLWGLECSSVSDPQTLQNLSKISTNVFGASPEVQIFSRHLCQRQLGSVPSSEIQTQDGALVRYQITRTENQQLILRLSDSPLQTAPEEQKALRLAKPPI